MPKSALSLVHAAALLASVLSVRPAAAQVANAQTWVSGTGNDANTASQCPRTAPCQTLAAALTVTAPGGQITCIDPIFQTSPLTVSTSVTIDCSGSEALVLAFGGPGINIATPGTIVVLRGLTIYSAPVFAGTIGVNVTAVAVVRVENCKIFGLSGSPALGIRFAPSAPGSQLVVSDTVVTNNGFGVGGGGGIQVAPQPGGSAGVVLNRVQLSHNVTALALQSFNGSIGAVMRDSVVSSNRSNGILSLAGVGTTLTVERSSLVNNIGAALQSAGANSLVTITESTITGNQVGLSSIGGGGLRSAKNNLISGNGSNGTPVGGVALE